MLLLYSYNNIKFLYCGVAAPHFPKTEKSQYKFSVFNVPFNEIFVAILKNYYRFLLFLTKTLIVSKGSVPGSYSIVINMRNVGYLH